MEGKGGRSERAIGHHMWWQLVALAAVSFAAVYAGAAFKAEVDRFLPESRTFTSTLNRKPSGLSALAEITRKAGLTTRTWQLPYRLLGQVKGVLVIVQPDEPLSPFEVEQILEWVGAGNNLIYLDQFAFQFEQRLIQKLGLRARLVDSDQVLADAKVAPDKKMAEFAHVQSLTVSAESRLEGGDPLLADESGTLVAAVNHGHGRVIAAVSPSLCANWRLSSQSDWSNFQFMVNCFRTAAGDVIFDELCHGYSRAPNVFIHILKGPAGPVFLQIAACLAVALVSAGQRFGASELLLRPRNVSSLEFIEGLAGTYRRAGATALVLKVIGRSFEGRLARAMGVGSGEPAGKIVEAWSQATGSDGSELASLLTRLKTAAEGKQVSEEQLADLVSACDKISERAREQFRASKGVIR